MEEDFTEESSDGTLVRGDDHSYDAHKFPAKPLLRPGWPKVRTRRKLRHCRSLLLDFVIFFVAFPYYLLFMNIQSS